MDEIIQRHPPFVPDASGLPPDAIRLAYDAVTNSMDELAAYPSTSANTDSAYCAINVHASRVVRRRCRNQLGRLLLPRSRVRGLTRK